MNKLFRRIAALLEGQVLPHRLAWASDAASKTVALDSKALGHAGQDFRDTDIAVAWLCEASNKTRYSGRLRAP